jgi:predicted phage terminase large subunit-like protein
LERRSYWEYKEPIAKLLAMEAGQGTDAEGTRMSRHVFAGQYMQSPIALGGNIIRGSWFPRYTVLPKIKWRKIFADTAQKTAERNDFSVFECWGLGDDGRIYLLDMIRGKWEAPELERRAIAFWAKQSALSPENFGTLLPWIRNPPADSVLVGQLRKMVVEDKSSGTGLIQKIRLVNTIPVQAVERVKDKLTRVMDVVSYWEAGLACLPELAPFTNDFVLEAEAFTADDSHAYDDQIDPLVDATVDMLSSGNKLKTWEKLGVG